MVRDWPPYACTNDVKQTPGLHRCAIGRPKVLEATLGAVPIVGDVFHVFWKANRRNDKLLIREKAQPGAETARDWMFLGLILLGGIAAVGIPIAIVVWIFRALVG
jgi:hypothetical protein